MTMGGRGQPAGDWVGPKIHWQLICFRGLDTTLKDIVYAGNLFLPQWNLGAPEVWGDGTSLPACQHVASGGLPKTLLS